MRYELKLLTHTGRMLRIYQLECLSDEQAKEVILAVADDYARFELWRGTERVAEGGQFIVAGLKGQVSIPYHGVA